MSLSFILNVSAEEIPEKRVLSLVQLNPTDPCKTSASNIILTFPPLHCQFMHFEVPVAASSCYWWWWLLRLICFCYPVYYVGLFDCGFIDVRNTLQRASLCSVYWIIKFPESRESESYIYWTVHHLDSWIKREQKLQPASGYHTTPAKPQRNTNTHRTKATQPMK